MGASKQIGGESCAPARPGKFIAAESIWLHNSSRSSALINSITLEQPSNIKLLGFYLDDIKPRGSGALGPGNAWAPISSGVAALHARSAIGYTVPARTGIPRHALRVAVEPVDSAQPWSYVGLVIRYHVGGHRYRLTARTELIIPPVRHACTDALMNTLR